jgi:hypothetical protein
MRVAQPPHFSNEGILLDRHGSEIDDLAEACEHAARLFEKYIASSGPQDWRNWTLTANDGDGEELVPSLTVLGTPH